MVTKSRREVPWGNLVANKCIYILNSERETPKEEKQVNEKAKPPLHRTKARALSAKAPLGKSIYTSKER